MWINSYYGLRDYNTATWDGGDADCDHVQVKEARKAASGSSRLGFPADGGPRRITDDNDYFAASKGQQYRDVCGKCGARRVDDQIGLEPTVEQYVARLVAVFREVRRVLRPDATCWIVIGDSYGRGTRVNNPSDSTRGKTGNTGQVAAVAAGAYGAGAVLQDKQLLGIPWRLAFALQADGWILRSEIIWHKRAPMPESVTDRPTKAHEQVFLLVKNATYYYDSIAIMEPQMGDGRKRGTDSQERALAKSRNDGGRTREDTGTRNKRSVWTLGPESYAGAHFATFPQKLVEPMVLAGSSPKCCAKCLAPYERVTEREKIGQLRPMTGSGGVHPQSYYSPDAENGRLPSPTSTLNHVINNVTTGWAATCPCAADVTSCVVLDPFSGAATTGIVAIKHGRRYIGCELNESYNELARRRLEQVQPMLQFEVTP